MTKKNTVLALAMAVGTIASAQLGNSNFSGTNADLDATGRNPRLDFAFQQVRNQTPPQNNFKIEGSAFFHEDFRKASIYSKDGLEGILYLRYDGYRDQLQIKPISENEETQVLLARKDIYCVLNEIPLKYKAYTDKKGRFKEGYLFVLVETDAMVLYEKRAKLFREGKEAKTSLELDVPNRFVESRQLFLGQRNKDEERIAFIKPSKKTIYALFEGQPEIAKKIRQFFSEKRLNLKSTEDIIAVFKYYKTL